MAFHPGSPLHFERSLRLHPAHQHLDPGWVDASNRPKWQIETPNEGKATRRIQNIVQRRGANVVLQSLKATFTTGVFEARIQCRGCAR